MNFRTYGKPSDVFLTHDICKEGLYDRKDGNPCNQFDCDMCCIIGAMIIAGTTNLDYDIFRFAKAHGLRTENLNELEIFAEVANFTDDKIDTAEQARQALQHAGM